MPFIHGFRIDVNAGTGFGHTSAAAAVSAVLLNRIRELPGVDRACHIHGAGFAVRDQVTAGDIQITLRFHIQGAGCVNARLFVGSRLIVIFRTTTGTDAEGWDRRSKPIVTCHGHTRGDAGMPAGGIRIDRILP